MSTEVYDIYEYYINCLLILKSKKKNSGGEVLVLKVGFVDILFFFKYEKDLFKVKLLFGIANHVGFSNCE